MLKKNISEICSTFPLALQTTSESPARELICSSDERAPDTVSDAGRDLFLWSVLQNQKELAQITWEQVLIYYILYFNILEKISV